MRKLFWCKYLRGRSNHGTNNINFYRMVFDWSYLVDLSKEKQVGMFSKEKKKSKKKKKVVNKTCKIVVPPSLITVDRNFSRRIRLEGLVSVVSPTEIYGICVTCNKLKLIIGQLHCGHYMTRDNSKVRFDPRNSAPQCIDCNTYGKGEQAKYRIYMVRKYGEKVTQEIEAMAKLGYYKIPDDELIKVNEESKLIINKICKDRKIDKWW